MMGPFNTPLALGKEPVSALFWVVCAPILFLYGAAIVAQMFVPVFEAGTDAEIEAYKTLWLCSAVGMAVWFAAISFWSETSGAGAFAGRMHQSPRWIVFAALIGPVLLWGPSLIADALMQADGWQYTSDINQAVFAPENWTLAYIFMAVVLAPLAEEVTFRGVGMGALLARGVPPIAVIALTSAAFAMIHLQYSPAAMLVVFVTGAGFGVLRLVSGSVVVPIVAHAAANANALFLTWAAAPPA